MLQRLLLLLPALLLSTIVSAQIGLSGRYFRSDHQDWPKPDEQILSDYVNLPGDGWEAGIDYWFRLKNVRIEFLPTLSYGQAGQTLREFPVADPLEVDSRVASFFWHTNIYFLDFYGDCDCPTFSKGDPIFKKGLFLQLSPGVSHFQTQVSAATFDLEAKTTAFGIGAGLGLDLGLSDLITLTPMASVRYYPGITVADLDVLYGDSPRGGPDSERLVQWTAGLRLGFRFAGSR